MEFELENGQKIEIPEVGQYDKDHILFNGYNALYFRWKDKWSCPVCGNFVLSEPWKNCICPVCGWEDDEMDCIYADMAIGINPISFNQAMELWEKYHDDYRNHEDEWKLTFGIPEIDDWIAENAGQITADDLLEKVKEYYGDADDDEEYDDEEYEENEDCTEEDGTFREGS